MSKHIAHTQRVAWRTGIQRWLVVAMVMMFAAATLTVTNPAPAAAETNVTNGYVRAPQTWYTYVKAGETFSSLFRWADYANSAGVNPRIHITRPDGTSPADCANITYTATNSSCGYSQVATVSGVYSVSIVGAAAAGGNSTAMSWNIGAKTSGGTSIAGRTWTEEYKMYDYPPDDVQSLPLWYVTEQGYRYKVVRSGITGIDSTYQANAFGNVNATTCASAYRSIASPVPLPNLNPTFIPLTSSTCGYTPYKIFFAAPDTANLPATVLLPSGASTWLIPPTLSPVSGAPLTFTQAAPGSRSGTVNYMINNFEGTATLQVDANNDGIFTGILDRTVTVPVIDGQAMTWAFDGKDATGATIAPNIPVAFRISTPRVAEVHFTDFDIEMLTGGIEVTRVDSGLNALATVYWDDSYLTAANDSQAGKKCSTMAAAANNLSGMALGTAHSWGQGSCVQGSDTTAANFFNTGPANPTYGGTYGNNRSIDNWTYVTSTYFDSVDVPGYKLTKTAVPATGSAVDPGSTIAYTVGVQPVPYAVPSVIKSPATTWSARVTDDLTKVRDDADATLVDLAATPAAQSTMVLNPNGWTWTGQGIPLATNASITYSATVHASKTGDGAIYNVAYVNPTNTTPPPPTSCLPLICGETIHTQKPAPGKLEVTKSNTPGTGTVVAPGTDVTYTLTFKNTGELPVAVAYTDHLSDVLDDAMWKGGPSYTGTGLTAAKTTLPDKLTITGSVAPGATVTVSYVVTVKAGTTGDGTLRNLLGPSAVTPPTTCVPGADPAWLCTVNPVKGSFTLAKSSVPTTGANVNPGDTITYTVVAQGADGPVSGIVIKDDLTAVLNNATFVAGSAKLTIGTGTPASVPNPTGTNPILLQTAPFNLTTGQTATLTYQVIVKADAWSKTLVNVVTGSSTGGIPPTSCLPCTTTHPTPAKLLIKKIGESGTATWVPMEGSTWSVFNDNAGIKGTPYTGTGVTAVQPASIGTFQLQNIPAGTYWLTETKAPTGFSLLAEPVQFIIAANGTVTLGLGAGNGVVTVAQDTSGTGFFTITVRDVPALKMPESGGPGTQSFLIGGSLILLATFTLIVGQRRRRNRGVDMT